MRDSDPPPPPAWGPAAPPDQDRDTPAGVWRKAAALFLGLLVVYHLNGTFQETNDAAFSTFLPEFVLGRHSLTVTPTEMPSFFVWEMRGPKDSHPVAVVRWDDESRRARESGRLGLVGPRYYFLVPTPQTDPRTGETRYANTFGVGAGLTALPVFAGLEVLGGTADRPAFVWAAAKFAAATLVAASAVFVFLTCLRYTTPSLALLIAAAYGLGTCVWSISSQALWQHGPSEFFLALGTLCLTRSRGNRWYAAGCGLAYALAVVCRVPNALVVVAAGLHFLIADRRGLLPYVVAGLPVAAALGAYNGHFHGSPVSFGRAGVDAWFAKGKTGSPDVWQTPLADGLAGLLFSPSRGLLVHSPVLAFGLAGLALVWRKPEYRELRAPAVGALALVVLASKWYDWWGGWCFGYRPVVDAAPLLAVLMVPVIGAVWRHTATAGVFVLLFAWSVGVQVLGAFAYDPQAWNGPVVGYRVVPAAGGAAVGEAATLEEAERVAAAAPGRAVVAVRADIDMPAYRRRLWSVTDSQLGYLVRHFATLRQSRRASNKSWAAIWK